MGWDCNIIASILVGKGTAEKKVNLCSLDQQIIVAHSDMCTIAGTRTNGEEDEIYSIGGYKVLYGTGMCRYHQQYWLKYFKPVALSFPCLP